MLNKTTIVLCMLCVLLLGTANAVTAQETTTITGILTDDFQIVTEDGSIYMVEASKITYEMFEYTGNRVRATGMLEITENGPLFSVFDFEIIE